MFELYAMQLQVQKTRAGAECPTYGLLNWNQATFNGIENFCERWRLEPLGGSGGIPPRKFSNLKALKCYFQHYQADSCIKNVPKIDRYFLLNFQWQKEHCHQLYYVFIINNYCHTPLMLAKYDTSFLPRTKTCTVYFYLLFIYAPRA